MIKKERSYKTKFIHIRVSPEEFHKIEKRWKASTCPRRSNYLRKMLLQKPIVATYRNRSLDDFMEEMIQLRKELSGIRKGFDQVLEKHPILQETETFRRWIITYELERKVLFNKVDEIKNKIRKIAEKWLQ